MSQNSQTVFYEIKNRGFVKFLLLSLGLVSVMCTGAIAPSLPFMAKHYAFLNNSHFLVRLVTTAPHLVICITSMPFGYLLNFVDRPKTIIISLFFYSFFGSVCFFLDNIKYIIVCRVFLGLFISIILSCFTTMISDLFKGKERESVVGFQTTFMSVGTVLYNLLSGFITDNFNWKYNFLLYSTPMFLLPFYWNYLYKLPSHLKIRLLKKTKKETNYDLTPLGQEQSNGVIFAILFFAFINMTLYYMIPLQLPFFLKTTYNSTSSKIAFVMVLETISTALFSSVYQRIKGKIASHQLLLSIAFFAMSVCYFLVSMSTTYNQMFFLMFVYGFGMGIVMPNITVLLINKCSKKNRGLVLGSMYTAFYFGKFFCSILIYILTNLGFETPRDRYFFASLVLLCASILVNFLHLLEKKNNLPKTDSIIS